MPLSASKVLSWAREHTSYLILALTVVLFLLLRTSQTDGIESLDTLDATFTGQPVVLEFYSNLWATCLLAKPVVDRLEDQLVDKAQVVRLDLWTRVGRQAAARYGVRGTPMLVVVDGSGQPVYGRYGIPVPSQVVEHVDTLLAAN